MYYLLKIIVITFIIFVVNHFLLAPLPAVENIDFINDKLISIFPPTWESLLNPGEIIFGLLTLLYLIFLTAYTESLEKNEEKGIFSSDYYIILLNMAFVIDGTLQISILFLIFYVVYFIFESRDPKYDSKILPVLFFAVALFPFSVLILLHKIHSPNLVDETLGFLFLLLGIRFYKNRIE